MSNWLARGRLPKARRLGRGVWEFNQAELIEAARAHVGHLVKIEVEVEVEVAGKPGSYNGGWIRAI